MKTTILIIALFCSLPVMNSCGSNANAGWPLSTRPQPEEATKIQVAILLDASNSMDGLIDQAKSRLWNIVNTLTTLKYNGETPDIEIALYMYGNDGLSEESNYIKQITPFTSDLDLISEKLFAITTNGGSEYCGAVIEHAVNKLDWESGDADMKLIYIAGNEEFTQGKMSYVEAISSARKKDIYVNTIHCGNCEEGVSGMWKDGATKGEGKYFCINSDEKVFYVETPYDDEINRYNEKLNKTYIYYGSKGQYSYTNQSAQDANAQSISYANSTERAVSKSKDVYKNDEWDLIDKAKEDPGYVNKVDKSTLPTEYQNLSEAELENVINEKTLERGNIQTQIQELSKKRQAYIDAEMKKAGDQDDFGNVINKSIIEFANKKGYKVD